jgi:hypothetical protein
MDECRNGHERTEANTYVNPASGKRQCRLCPGWKKRNAETGARPERRVAKSSRRREPADHVRRLRALIPCLGCGQTLQDVQMPYTKVDGTEGVRTEARVPHWPTCPVLFAEAEAAEQERRKANARRYSYRQSVA